MALVNPLQEYCLPASEIASNYYHLKKNNRPRYFIDDPDLPPPEHAAPYVQDELDRLGELDRKRRALGRVDEGSHRNDISADKILKRAKLLVATEISKDPLMRKEIREIFKNSAEVSCYPTDKGLVKIDEHHPYYVSGCFRSILIIHQPPGRTSNTFKKSPSQK